MRGRVVVISGPSGVGKSTICREVIKRLDNLDLSVSMTTRAPGPGEEDGRDYWFVSEEEFRRRMQAGLLLESAEVVGNRYGTPKGKGDEALEAGRSVVLEIDVQGGRQVKAVYEDAVMVFVLPPNDKVLAERIGLRGRDSKDVVQTRLGGVSGEIAAAWQHYNNMVINEDLDRAIAEVIGIITNALSGETSSEGQDGNVGGQ